MEEEKNKLTKSNKYVGVYTKQVKNDTKIYISYHDGKNYSRHLVGLVSTGVTQAYAFELRNQEIAKLKLGEDPKLIRKKDVILFGELAKDWMEKQRLEQLSDAKQNSQRYYNHIHKVFEKTPIKDIKPHMILEFKQEKLKTLQPATVYHLCGIINSIFHNAIHRTGKMAGKVNPAYKIFTKSEFNNKRERWLTLEEIQLLLKTVQEIDHPMSFIVEAFIRLSLATGIRVTSCLTLQRKHINLETRELTCWDAKNKEFYKIYLNEKMLPDEFLHKLTDGLKPEHYLLYLKNRRLLIKKLHRFTYPIFKMLFNADIDDANEKQKVCHHTLRHTFATHAVMHNDIFIVQKMMNHKDINQTLRYAKTDDKKKAEAVSKMF
ncbi:MAG: site-specific integrase [Campylobacterales bacterium]|nr:site-specific integrase [Campylobacterales bacterium]